MISASVFELIEEGLAEGTPVEIATGMAVGVVLVVVAYEILMDSDIDPREYEEADFKKLVLILGILTVHSFPEGVAIGVSLADLGLEGGIELVGFTVPVLAIFMTIANLAERKIGCIDGRYRGDLCDLHTHLRIVR